MDSRSRPPLRRSPFLSATHSPYARARPLVGRSIRFQAPSNGISDLPIPETSVANAATLDTLAPETPGNNSRCDEFFYAKHF